MSEIPGVLWSQVDGVIHLISQEDQSVLLKVGSWTLLNLSVERLRVCKVHKGGGFSQGKWKGTPANVYPESHDHGSNVVNLDSVALTHSGYT